MLGVDTGLFSLYNILVRKCLNVQIMLERLIKNCGIDVGDVVLSTAGRDRDGYYIVTKVEGEYVYLVDGDLRKVENPKKKKMKHIVLTEFSDDEMTDRLVKNNKVTNHDIKKCLKNMIRNA